MHYSLIDPKDLSISDKAYIIKYFFDLDKNLILINHQHYQSLSKKRLNKSLEEAINSFSIQDFTDLIFLYNLAFLPIEFIKADFKINKLYNQGMNYTFEDIKTIINSQFQIINKIISTHSHLFKEGTIELSSSPYSHPILPLLIDSKVARIPEPELNIPEPPFRFEEDALKQLNKGREIFNNFLNHYPKGLWPSEGAVCSESLKYIKTAGYDWIATDEGILENSINQKVRINNYLPNHNLLYKVYEYQGIKIFFRDRILSDKIGFVYQHLPAEEAVNDFISYLHQVYSNSTDNNSCHILVALDGENPWDYYPQDGSYFIKTLFSSLVDLGWVKITNPSEFLKNYRDTTQLKTIKPGSWIDSNFNTWIGHPEKNCAWELLRYARQIIAKMESNSPMNSGLKEAYEHLYSAEGSDWFWWYGRRLDNGREKIFDLLFRRHLSRIYSNLGIDTPPNLDEPISQH